MLGQEVEVDDENRDIVAYFELEQSSIAKTKESNSSVNTIKEQAKLSAGDSNWFKTRLSDCAFFKKREWYKYFSIYYHKKAKDVHTYPRF